MGLFQASSFNTSSFLSSNPFLQPFGGGAIGKEGTAGGLLWGQNENKTGLFRAFSGNSFFPASNAGNAFFPSSGMHGTGGDEEEEGGGEEGAEQEVRALVHV